MRSSVRILFGLLFLLGSGPRLSGFVISEIHYHPPVGEEDLEFIEISNDSATPQDLSGWRFVEGISYTFPPGTILEGDAVLVIARLAVAVRERYGIENVLGNYLGQLDDGGERITIVNHAGRVVQSVRYDDQGEWPVAPDGTGHTLVLRSVYRDPAEPENWVPSPELGGSPGQPNFPAEREPEYEVTVYLDEGEDWRFAKGSQPFSEPATAWREEGFDDSGWLVGPAGFGMGDDDDRTILDDMEDGYSSVAIRTRVLLSRDELEAPGDLFLGMTFDDGFCAYINGAEVARSRCPDGVEWNELATGSHEANEEELFSIDESLLRAGENLIAVAGFNRTLGSNDFSLLPRLLRRRLIEEEGAPDIRACFNELYRGDGSGNGWIEIFNCDSSSINLSGMRLTEDPAREDPYIFPAGSIIGPRGFLVVSGADTFLDLFTARTQLFLLDPGGFVLAADSFDRMPPGLAPADFAEARLPDGGRPRWITTVLTPGAENVVPRTVDLVINEIFYHPPEDRSGEFIELYNRGPELIDLGGFRFTDGIAYTMPEGTLLGPGEYLVLSDDPDLLREQHGLERVLGPYDGGLSNGGENLRLVDRFGNLVDEVRYRDGGRWSSWADGGGSSLELIDPFQDNACASAWGASDESGKAPWERLSYVVPRYAPAGESELHILMAERGVCHIDDISIATQAFEETPILAAGADWRFLKGLGPFSASPLGWTEEGFDDSDWPIGPSGFGFGDEDDTTILDDMRANYTSVALRTTFELSAAVLEDPAGLFLTVDYDDGYCAFLNGVEIARANCPEGLGWNATATKSREAGEADLIEIPRERLRPGRNLLAVVGFNFSISSNDFSLLPRVVQRRAAGLGENHIPNPGFEQGTPPWRIEGTHIHSRRITEDRHSGAACLELVATGKGDSTCNRIETDTSPRLEAKEYEVSLWARWQRGGSLLILHGEFAPGPWFGTRDLNMSNNSLGARLRMTIPENLGTPGRENSLREALRAETGSDNLGPVIAGVRHRPLSPEAGVPARVLARVSDHDGVSSVRAVFRDDRAAEFDSAELFDDGASEDGEAGDGLYGGLIGAFANGTRVVFFVEAVDGLGAVRRFPVEAPDRTLLYMVEGAVNEQIQIVMDARNASLLDSRRLQSNDLLDGSFMFKDDDAYYNVGLRYRGSPWGRPQKQSYRVRFLKDQHFHRGRKEMNISNRDRNDGIWNFLIGRNSRPDSAAPAFDYQYVSARINGRSLGAPGFFETMGRGFLERWYGADAVDDIVSLKARGRLRFDDAGTRTGWDEATVIHMNTDSENYRFYWSQAIHQNRDKWEPFYEVTRVLDQAHTSNEDFDRLIHDVLDVEGFLRVLAPRIMMNDGDALFVGNGHNGYMVWNPLDGLWSLAPFDMGFADANAGNLLNVRDTRIRRLFQRSGTLRTHYRVIDEYVNGYWSELAAPFLSALQSSPGRTGAGTAAELRVSSAAVKRQLRSQTDVEFRILTNGGADFESAEPSIRLEGEASVRVVDMLVSINGEDPRPLEVTWSDSGRPVRWTAAIAPAARENSIQIFGAGADGDTIETASITVTSTAVETFFLRGDARADGRINIGDVVTLLRYAFRGLDIDCADAADFDDNGRIEIADAVKIMEFLFLHGDAPAAPFPLAGPDPTPDALECGARGEN